MPFDNPTPYSELDDAGFSLIEVLVALAVLALGAAAFIEVGERHIENLQRLEDKAAATWVAENKLTKLRLRKGAILATSETRQMMGKPWAVTVNQTSTEDPSLIEVTIEVTDPQTKTRVAELNGFLDIGFPQ